MSRYRLGRCVGRGGMGAVWEAWRQIGDDASQQRVAIKRILTERAQDARARELFRREGKIALGLSHPAIVKVFDFVCEDGELMIVMEFVEGRSVEALSCAEALEAESVRRILRTMLEALAYLHARGILHRDITPRNVMVSKDGDVIITDFGLARWLVGSRSDDGIKGTAAFSSPEQLMGELLDESADLYAVAAVGYSLLGMSPPFGGGNDRAQIKARMMAAPAPPLPDEVSADLRQVIESMLTMRDERPYKTAAEMLAGLDAPVEGPQALAAVVHRTVETMAALDEKTVETVTQGRLRVRRLPKRWRLGLVAGVLSVGAAAMMLRGSGSDGAVPVAPMEHAEVIRDESPDVPVSLEVPRELDADATGEPEAERELAAGEPEAGEPEADATGDLPGPRLDGVAKRAVRKRSPQKQPATANVAPEEILPVAEDGAGPEAMQLLTIISEIEAVPAILSE